MTTNFGVVQFIKESQIGGDAGGFREARFERMTGLSPGCRFVASLEGDWNAYSSGGTLVDGQRSRRAGCSDFA
jgi:hypothetical protein